MINVLEMTMKKTAAFLLALLICFTLSLNIFAEPRDKTEEAIDGIIKWSNIESKGSKLTYYEWYIIGIARYDREKYRDSIDACIEALQEYVTDRYKTDDLLDRSKATEWHRIALASAACGYDPKCFGFDADGKPIDLVADGVYNRGLTAPLGKQGISGYIWGLITLNALDITVPEDACDSKNSIIQQLVEMQNQDGGFTLVGKASDVDITAQALLALYPNRDIDGVQDACDRAIEFLSQAQNENGGYTGFMRSEASESIAQVIIALNSCDIDIFSDARFIKNRTLYDALFEYQNEDGGFAHSVGEKSDIIASYQALLALVSIWRNGSGRSAIYDLSADTVNDPLPPNDTCDVSDDTCNISEDTFDTTEDAGNTPEDTCGVPEDTDGTLDQGNTENTVNADSTGGTDGADDSDGAGSIDSTNSTNSSANVDNTDNINEDPSGEDQNDILISTKYKPMIASAVVFAVAFALLLVLSFLKKSMRKKLVILSLICLLLACALFVTGYFESKPKNHIGYAYLTVECVEALEYEALDQDIRDSLPDDGYFLRSERVSVYEGDSVCDVLTRALEEKGIAFKKQTLGSAYFSSIGGLAEFDCGGMSGWTYDVNGVYPSKGSAAYKIENEDHITWKYSLEYRSF